MTGAVATDRSEVRRILADQAGGTIVAPMLERHAARLEQLSADRTAFDTESLARALRGVRDLYDLAVLTVGNGGEALVRSVERGARDPHSLLDTGPFSVAVEAMVRVRKVLGGRVAFFVTLPAAERLVTECRLSLSEAQSVLLDAIRACGDHEPDAFILTGHDEEPDPTHDTMGAFYGAEVIRVGQRPSELVAVWPDFVPPQVLLPNAYLITTPDEVRPSADPAEIRLGLARAGLGPSA